MAVMKMPSTSRGVFRRRGNFGEMVSFGSIPGGAFVEGVEEIYVVICGVRSLYDV